MPSDVPCHSRMSEVKPSHIPSRNPSLNSNLNPNPGANPSLSPGPSHEGQLWTSLKELLTSFNKVWTSNGILGPVWVFVPVSAMEREK